MIGVMHQNLYVGLQLLVMLTGKGHNDQLIYSHYYHARPLKYIFLFFIGSPLKSLFISTGVPLLHQIYLAKMIVKVKKC